MIQQGTANQGVHWSGMPIKHHCIAPILTVLFALVVSACADQSVPDDGASETEPTATHTQTVNEGAIASDAGIPDTVEDPEWTSRFSPDIPYYNVTDEAVPVFAGADPRTALRGQIGPGDGGIIQTCAEQSTFCKIEFGGEGASGWVDMTNFSGMAD